MLRFKNAALAAALSAALMGAPAQAATFTFAGLGGDLGETAVFTDGAHSVTAIAINTEQPPTPSLHQGLFGLGVNLGLLDSNQIDNVGDDEAIVFDFGVIVNFESITLSLASFFDDYRIWGTNDGSVASCTAGGLSCLTSVSSLIASGAGSGLEGLVTVNLMGNAFRYLIATVPGGSGDGYKVKSLAVSEVPVPGALVLLLTGLAGLGFAGRRTARA
ncbi:hypothetical protein [Amphiplicatus metriothermophilus]|uniref:VPLPA-CTERM protein sorting domain-containing protein n=1 Tax=Amphiplicatus metriothermophilus TaxID=1519374 RepID=A0A239PNZ0_9PROT|nr:hypothetical protein [Amphiplicatus metriothermophilus]MBB5518825.1 hypothetical protein [Amphiplicatus metriothermophilus]SNT72021.1 VPLPA-CTERM protein sorting domain-containing protein [Amphiplicatus metriothermophilus]